MRNYARVQDGVVVETFATDADITTLFHPDMGWIEAPIGAVEGWTYSFGNFTAPDSTVADLSGVKASKLAEITASCLAAIDGGFYFNGHRYDSDLVSRTNIIGTATSYQAGIELPDGFVWRTADQPVNQFVPLDGPSLIQLGGALLQHVNGQYEKSWQLKQAVEAASTAEEVLSVVW